ncbi:DUF4760 domain-containing protein [Sphingomonas sp. RP10(2022)]|uniref:DUF4760 domain-containing protein n=1 Tax=Sphingomonas liriopis TaxID=2949094 RepID=A0A9X2HQB2_9SPHN|nr:DUF4760 domain-containing protein [Sphingomonas liriopis]MCP3734507.1 DUF4760 domain-containing protein [Sphingomonas liriopis]
MYHEWAVQRSICHGILQGRAEAVFSTYTVDAIDQSAYRRMADDALTVVIRRRSAAKRYFRIRIKNPIWIGIAFATTFGALAFAAAVVLARWIDLANAQTYPIVGAMAGFCAIGVAAIGWGVSGWITHRTARSKLTMDVVAARFAQPAFNDALTAFNTIRREHHHVTSALVDHLAASPDENDRKALQGLRYLLNYFEFIAVGVTEGELDERIVAQTLRGNITYVYDTTALYILDLQAKNPRTLEHFTALRRHYREP